MEAYIGFLSQATPSQMERALAKGRESPMSDKENMSNLKKNQYIFAGVGAVLGGLLGAGVAGAATAVVGIVVGGLLGHQLLRRIGS